MRRLRLGLAALPVLFVAACATLSNDAIAPPPPSTDSMLVQGRRLYLTTCVRCHAPEPIVRYSRAEWLEILPEMIADSKMKPADAEAVTRYVLSLR